MKSDWLVDNFEAIWEPRLMKTLFTACFAATLAVSPFVMTGCKPAATPEKPAAAEEHGDHDDHGDHGDHEGHSDHAHPETYADAVHEIEEMHGAIKAAFAKKDKDAAHGPLHDIGHILEEVDELAAKASLSAEQLAAVKKANEVLFDGYTKLDDMFHDGDEVKYEDLSKELDAALVVLQGATKMKAKEGADKKDGAEKKKEAPKPTKKKVRKEIPKDPSML